MDYLDIKLFSVVTRKALLKCTFRMFGFHMLLQLSLKSGDVSALFTYFSLSAHESLTANCAHKAESLRIGI
jgi:hypothetical protein